MVNIANMIAGYSEQQTGQANILSQQLQQLGQQVGQSLAMREYQKQYQAALPVIENTMRSATQKIQAGDFTGGYAEAVSGLPLMSQNPLIASASKSYLDSIGQVAEFQQSALWQQLQRSRMGGGGVSEGLPAMGPSGAQTAMSAMYGEQFPAETAAMPAGQPEAIMLPDEGQPIEGALPQGEVGEAESLVLTEGEVPPMQQPQLNPVEQQNAATGAQLYSAPAADQTRAMRGAIAGKMDEGVQWDKMPIEGLSRFYPKVNISDQIAIAPVGSKVKYSETWSGETDKPGARFSGNKEIMVDAARNEEAKKFAGKLQADVNLLTQTGPEGEDKYWVDIIEEAGGIENVIPQRNEEGFSIKPKGKESRPVTEDVFRAVLEVKGLSAVAPNTGIKLLPENVSGPGVRGRKFGSVEEALASGLPVGTTVYILKDGKYKPARIRE